MPTIAELAILFTASDSGFQRVNTSVQKALGQTSAAAEDTSTWLGLLERAIADLSDVERIATGDTRALTAEIKSLGKAAAVLDKALDASKVSAYATALGTLDGVGSALSVELAELQKTVASLNRAFTSQSPEGYGQKSLASSTSVDTLALSATEAEARILALNQQLAATRALVPRNINVNARAGGGGGSSNSALGSAGLAVGRSLEKNVTVPILAAGAASVYLETSFQALMAKIEALSGISHDQVKRWGDEILDLGPKMGKMPIELAQGMFYVANEIKDSAQAMDVLGKAAGMSAEGMGKTEANAKALVFVMHDYADVNMTAAQAADTLVAATRVGNFDVSALTANLGKLLPVASSLDIPFNQVAGAIAAMTKEGATIPQSTTAIQRTLLGLEKPSAGAQKALKAIGTSAQEVVNEMKTDFYGTLLKVADAAHKHNVALSEIFTTANGFKAVISVLGKDLDDSRKTFDDVTKSAGAYQRALDVVNQTDLMTLNKSLASLESAGIKLGDDLAPEVYALAKDIGELADAFRRLNPETQTSIVRVALLFAAVGPLIKAFGLLEKAIVLAKGANVGMNLTLWLTAPAGAAAAGGLEVAADEATVTAGRFAFLTTEINGARLALAGLGAAGAAYAGWQIGTLARNMMDEGAQAAGYANTGDYLYGKLGGLSDLFDISGPGHVTGDEANEQSAQPAPGFYMRWMQQSAVKRRMALQNQRDEGDAESAIDAGHRQYTDDQRRKKAQQDSASIIGGGGGGRGSRGSRESQEQREADQRLQALQERMQSLAQTLRMNGNESDAAAARYEALFGEFVDGATKAAVLKKAIDELTPKQKNDAAGSLFHAPFKALSGDQQARAEMVALTVLVESKKKSAEATKEQAAAQKALNDELMRGRAELMAGKATTDEDRVSWMQFGKPFAKAEESAKQTGDYGHVNFVRDQARLDKDKQAASVDPSTVQMDNGDALLKQRTDQLKADLARAQLAGKVSRATSDESAISLEAGFGDDWKRLPAEIQNAVRAMADLRRNAQAAKVDVASVKFSDGSELVAKMKSTYLEALHTLNKEIADTGKQTLAVRVATNEWDDAGAQMGKRMTHDQARQLAALQIYLAQLKEAKAETDAIASKASTLLTGGAQHLFDHGFRGLPNYFKTESTKSVQGMLLDTLQKKSQNWLGGLLGGKQQDKQSQLIAAIDAQIAALNANTASHGGTPTMGGISAPGAAGTVSGIVSSIPGLGGNSIASAVQSVMRSWPGFASGGDYSGGPMIVGENGPEVVVPNSGGRVIPNDQLGGETHNHYGPTNVHFHVQDSRDFNPTTARQHARTVVREMKENR